MGYKVRCVCPFKLWHARQMWEGKAFCQGHKVQLCIRAIGIQQTVKPRRSPVALEPQLLSIIPPPPFPLPPPPLPSPHSSITAYFWAGRLACTHACSRSAQMIQMLSVQTRTTLCRRNNTTPSSLPLCQPSSTHLSLAAKSLALLVRVGSGVLPEGKGCTEMCWLSSRNSTYALSDGSSITTACPVWPIRAVRPQRWTNPLDMSERVYIV